MASRLLSNTLQSQAGLTKQFVRPLATAAKQVAATRTTVLSNGLTIATEENTTANGAATVGVWIDAGSRAESASNSGAANLIGRIALKNGKQTGGELTARTTHDQTYYAAKTIGSNVEKTVQSLSEIVQDLKLDSLESERAAVLNQQPSMEDVTFEHLHATAFQGTSLGLPVAGLNVENLTSQDLTSFVKANYTANRIVLVGAGDVEHDALVKLAEKSFGSLAAGSAAAGVQPSFTGSEIRLRDDLAQQAHIALAVEGAPFMSSEYLNLLVMQSIVGSWDSTLGGAANLSSRLSTVVNSHHLADSFASFTKGYKDTGLWGFYAATQNREQIDDLVHFLQKEWNRLSTTVTASEVERAKVQLKASLLLSLDSTSAVAKDIGSQILTTGKRLSGDELAQAIDKISVSDVRNTANKFIWDQELAVIGAGPIECLTDYTRVRGNMAYNRF
ncbi:Metalloenzyme, LuxS/M16 peptidase-like protein [Zychaea mexicana]|uniref:Metalloenzyme, LuxS/M16 peptidase-like protein n=1 Tax=Zychaea mexicana TaxID=64656 RepID=UPI0022FDFAF7|nr:Metalloenzyme, LuxS/M16 peptidase-like protein [Zychaea mexicana]KAI9498043.1 Metalloenzyme, LuxS/M16 peptidase-like protein [Zychaea mexicana]